MPEIRPLRAWRYSDEHSKRIGNLTSPLLDVVSEKQRQALCKKEYNSIHLSAPRGPEAANHAAELLAGWKANGIIVQDPLPGIYVYYQYFQVDGSSREYCRKGFISNIRVYDWDERIILPHENIIPKTSQEMTELLKKTEMNVSPTHGLYTDPGNGLEEFMEEAIGTPILETEDYQGVRDVLAVIHDAEVIQKFIDNLNDKTIILADGHNRYNGSLLYKKQCKSVNADHTGKEGYNFHMMYLTNIEAGDFHILPTHRLIKGIASFDESEILSKLEEDFTIKPVDHTSTINEHIAGKPWTFGILFNETAYKIRLKPGSFAKMGWHFPEEIRRLDLTVLHYFIIEKALGIQEKDQARSGQIDFEQSFSHCFNKVIRGEAKMAIITRAVSIDEIKRVWRSGLMMPQESAYFYPKVICGLLYGSIKEDEFQTPNYSRF